MHNDGSFLGKKVKEPEIKTKKTVKKRRYLENGEEVEVVVSPILKDGKLLGTVWLGYSLKKLSIAKRGILLQNISVAILMIAVGILASFLLSRGITISIKKLHHGAKIFAKGDLNYKIKVERKDEIGEVAKGFNQMAESLDRLQKKLVESERKNIAAQIAAEAAHEIRNPLAVISAGLFYLKEILPRKEEVKKRIQQIERAVRKLTSYLDDLINFSRPLTLNLMLVDINRLIIQTLEEFPLDIISNVKLKKDLSKNLPLIEADPERLKHIFVNLIKNACEAMQGEGELIIKSEKMEDGKYIQIVFENSGPKIPELDIPKIFDPFFTTKGKGTGLGLAVCKRIVEFHKGEIKARNKEERGTEFILKLPVKQRIF
jgi:signal transduction histidine kinase